MKEFLKKFRRKKKGASRRHTSALGRRRKKMFRLKVALSVFLVIVLVSLSAWLLRRPDVLVTTVLITGNEVVEDIAIKGEAIKLMEGTYLFLIPRNSAFFYPRKDIADAIDKKFPRISAVDVERKDFRTIHIDVEERDPFALWCGTHMSEKGTTTTTTTERCFFMDEQSYIFDTAPNFSGAAFFKYYGELAVPSEGKSAPLDSRYMTVENFSGIRPFIDAFTELGFTPTSFVRVDLKDSEVHIEGGGKIIFGNDMRLSVLLDNMQSILDSDLFREAEGKVVEYIDLRFGNKVVVRFVDEEDTTVQNLEQVDTE